MGATGIEYATKTWNMVVGCTPASVGCENCWARELHEMRHRAMLEGKIMPEQYRQPFSQVQVMMSRLNEPLRWREPQVVLTSSVGDLFHEDVPDIVLQTIFDVMERADQHIFLVLTKRVQRMRDFLKELWKERRWQPEHIWIGTSVENQQAANARLGYLLTTPAAHHWASLEPLIGEVRLDAVSHGGYVLNALTGMATYMWNETSTAQTCGKLEWVVAGGESGMDARPCHPDWARRLVYDCGMHGVPFWWKQWGPRRMGDAIDGKTYKNGPVMEEAHE
jgi:protein gp37